MKLYLRIGLVTGVPYGVLMSLFTAGFDSVASFAVRAALYGIAFGAIMALVLGTYHRRATRGDPAGSGRSAEETVELPVPAGEALRLAGRAAEALPKAGDRQVDEPERTVRLRVPASFKSWGETVELRVTGDGAASSVRVVSASRLRLTMVDYGKNRDNVRRVVEWLRAEAKREVR